MNRNLDWQQAKKGREELARSYARRVEDEIHLSNEEFEAKYNGCRRPMQEPPIRMDWPAAENYRFFPRRNILDIYENTILEFGETYLHLA